MFYLRVTCRGNAIAFSGVYLTLFTWARDSIIIKFMMQRIPRTYNIIIGV